MRVLHGLSGEPLLELEPGSDPQEALAAAAEALGVSPDLVRVTVTECAVVVLSGKVLCGVCKTRTACSCRAPDDTNCDCEELPESGSSFCDRCRDYLEQEERGQDDYERLKDAALW